MNEQKIRMKRTTLPILDIYVYTKKIHKICPQENVLHIFSHITQNKAKKKFHEQNTFNQKKKKIFVYYYN